MHSGEQQVDRRGAWLTLLALAGLALVLRLPDFGNPLLDLDDQFYALIGERMWQGALPYVDIWDRKPIGLFLIYAIAGKTAADPYLGHYLLALVAVIATAAVIAAMARRMAGAAFGVGLMTGGVYLGWVALLGGRGGQSPIFYNGLIAGAALLTHATLARPGKGRWRGAAAMALAGLALQIKPTVVFEGCWFGLALMAAAWRDGVRGVAWAGYGLALIAVALVPTLLAFGVYVALGHADAWWFANIESIFLRNATEHGLAADHLIGIGLVLAVPFAAALFALASWRGADRWFVGGWLAAAVAGLLAVPPYFNHYALPLLVPIALLAGIGMSAGRPFAALVIASGAAMLAWSGYPHSGETAAARTRLTGLIDIIDRYRGEECLFAFSAPPILYEAAHSCLPTRYPFGPHLTLAYEANAIGVDPVAEVARVLARRPPVIVVGPPLSTDRNHAAFALMGTVLRQHYVRVGGDRDYTIYAQRQAVASR